MLALLFAPAFEQTTAVDWDNKGVELVAYGKYDEAIQAYGNALEINPQDKIAWNNKANALKALGRIAEANAAYAKVKELEATGIITILDHTTASNVNESTRSVIKRNHDFSVNDSRAYSWLSLGNVGAGTVYWYWYSPAGNMLYTDKAQIPMPTGGPRWDTYNIWSHIDIAGKDAANLPGDWHVDVYLDGQKILTEYFSISGGQPPTAPENQYPYNPGKSDETTYKNLHNQGKYDEAISKGDKLKAEGRYDDAIYFYDEAINPDPNNFQNWRAWNSKGDALSKQGKYADAIQAYDKAIELVPDNPIVWANKGAALKALG